VTKRQGHLFGAFAPGASPDALARLHAAMARAVGGMGEDIVRPGAHIGMRGGRGPVTAGGGVALGLAALLRRPAEGRDDLTALAAALAAAADEDAAAAGPLAGFEGRFALALLRETPTGLRLDLARDPMGRAPLWTAKGPEGELLFATSPHALLAAPGVSRTPDPVSLAMLLAARDCGPGQAAYADLAQVPRGCRLIADARGARVLRLRRAAPDPALRGLAPADAMAALAAKVDAAILPCADAGGGRAAGLQFSGGLDSSLIAGVLGRAGRDIPGFATVPSSVEAPEERAARDAMARRWPGLRITEIPPDGADFLAGARAYAAHAAMPCPDPMAFNALHLTAAMAGAGIGASVTGMGGDFCLSSHGAPRLTELWRTPAAAIASIARRRAAGGRLRNILVGDLIKPLRGFEAWRRLRPAPPPAIIAPGALTQALAARMQTARASWHERQYASMAAEEAAQIDTLPAWTVQTLGAGPENLSPLLDADLIDAVLAMPPDLRLHHGMRRGLIRRLLGDIAPPEVAMRPDKTAFQPDYARLQAAAIPAIRAEGRAFADDPIWREVIDAPVWHAALDAAERAGPIEGLELSNTVMAPYFLGWWLMRRDEGA
jgi:asparagine synthase (glutamine-hydrolysing)